MKKSLIIFSFFLMSVSVAHSQTLEIIDAIGGSLLPKVVEGIKDIRNSGNNKTIKYDKDKFDVSIKDLSVYMQGIAGSLADDAKSLDAIGKMAASGSSLYDDLGAMETFINGNLIDAIIASNNEPVKRQFGLAFDRDLKQLNESIGNVKISISELAIDQSLKDELTKLIDAIKGEHTDLQAHVTQSGTGQITLASTIQQIDNYLSSMKSSASNINEIKRSIQNMLSTLNSRLSSYVKASASVKEKVNAKFLELAKPE